MLGGCPDKVEINPGELLGMVLEAQYKVRQLCPAGAPMPHAGERALALLHRCATLLNFIQESDRCPSVPTA